MEAKLIATLHQIGILDTQKQLELQREMQKEDMGKIVIARNQWSCYKVTKIDKSEFSVVMKYLRDTFKDNNEVSSKLLRIMPDIEEIVINEIANSSMDIPKIWCKVSRYTMVGVEVRRCHKIIWHILNAC